MSILRRSSLYICLFATASLCISFSFNTAASSGNDSDPRTYHFFPSGENGQLSRGDSTTPILNSEVVTQYQNADYYDLTIDGATITSLGWNFEPDLNGIGDTNWASSSYPSSGQFRIDTTRGRIKSNPSINWKYVTSVGENLQITSNASNPVLMKFERANSIVVGLVVGRGSSGSYEATTFTMRDSALGENIDDYTGAATSAWTVGSIANQAALPGIAASDVCTEIVSDIDQSNLGRVGFAVYCSAGGIGKAYGFEYASGWQPITTISTAVSADADISQHVAVAVDGTNSRTHYLYVGGSSAGGLESTIQCAPVNTGWCPASGFVSYFGSSATNPRCLDSRTTGGGGQADTVYGNAYDPAIDCIDGTCYLAFVQEMANVDTIGVCASPSSFQKHVVAAIPNSGTNLDTNENQAIHSLTRPLANSVLDKERPQVVAISGTGTNSAMVFYKERSFALSQIFTLKAAYFDGTRWSHDTNHTCTGCGTQVVVSQASNFTNDVGIRQIKARLGQGKDVFLFWTQADRSDFPGSPSTGEETTMENAQAQYVHFRRWRYGNITSANELSFDAEQQTRAVDANLGSFDFTRYKGGQGYINFVQNGSLYFAYFNGLRLPTQFEDISLSASTDTINHSTHEYASAAAIAYTPQPAPGAGSPSDGRAIVAWHEGGRFYSRAYYNTIDIRVSFNAQNFGTAVTPDGSKPPLVKNNYSRPGDSRPVDIYVNDRDNEELVTIRIFSKDGRLVKTVKDSAAFSSFKQPVQWDKTTASGNLVASGVYYVLVTTDKGYKKYHPVVIVR